MIPVNVSAKRWKILAEAKRLYPEWDAVYEKVRRIVPSNHKEVWEEQAAFIAYLASQYDSKDGRFLELGCNRGFTSAVMKVAAPKVLMTTLEPDPQRRREARSNVAHSLGVEVRPEQSTQYLEQTEGSGIEYELIFVDGDHKNIKKDLPWFNRLKVGGLFLHHDYSPLESARPCPPVYEALNDFGKHLGREPDVLVVDNTRVGMAGWYRRTGENW